MTCKEGCMDVYMRWLHVIARREEVGVAQSSG